MSRGLGDVYKRQELYVVTNRIDLAKERLEILKSCNCEEYQELKEIIEGTKKSKY